MGYPCPPQRTPGLYGLCVGGEQQSKRVAHTDIDRYLRWLDDQDRDYPKDLRLAQFLELYERIKSDRMLTYGTSKRFLPTRQQDSSVKDLNKFRNKFIHFVPQGISVQTEGLSQLVLDCVAIIEFLAFESDNISWIDPALQRRTRKAIRDLQTMLEA